MVDLRRPQAPEGRCPTSRFNWIDVLFLIVIARTCYIGLSRGLATELIKSLALLAGLIFAANFHEALAGLTPLAREQMANDMFPLFTEANMLWPAYLLILIVCLVFGRLVHHWLIVKWLKREHAGSWLEHLFGLLLGLARGWIVLGMLFLVLGSVLPDRPKEYVRSSVRDRSVTGLLVVRTTHRMLERLANVAPGHALRSELFPFS